MPVAMFASSILNKLDGVLFRFKNYATERQDFLPLDLWSKKMRTLRTKINDELSNKEIKSILINTLKLSSRLITKLKAAENGIMLNGKRVTVRQAVSEGDILEINIPDEQSENIVPTKMDLDIIYEDEDILLINKPHSMPTHPSVGHFENTLANGVMYRYKDTGFMFRAVNRLDRDTTGLVLIAKNSYSANLLCRQICEKRLKKQYLALCTGKFINNSGVIEEPIAREKESVIKRIVSPDGKYAKTEYTVIKYKDGYSLVRLYPITGRTHQIRVHMAYINHPLYSDFIYGKEIPGERMRLHCESMEFIHPNSGKICKFTAPCPGDFFITA